MSTRLSWIRRISALNWKLLSQRMTSNYRSGAEQKKGSFSLSTLPEVNVSCWGPVMSHSSSRTASFFFCIYITSKKLLQTQMLGSSILTQALRKVTPHNLLGRKTFHIEDQFSNATFKDHSIEEKKFKLEGYKTYRFHCSHLINLYVLLCS